MRDIHVYIFLVPVSVATFLLLAMVVVFGQIKCHLSKDINQVD